MDGRVVRLDGEGRIAGDLACLRCGYNLRLLGREALCPECGVGVERTIRGDLLRYSDAAWLRGVADGLGIVVITIAATLAITILSAVLFPFGADRPGGAAVIELLARIGCAVGAWRFGRPQPDSLRLEGTWAARRLVRVFGLLQVAPLTSAWPSLWPGGHGFIEMAIVGINIGYVASILTYARRLCIQAGAARDEVAARKLLAGCALSVGAILFGLAEEGRLFPWRTRGGAAIAMGLAAILGVSIATILFLARVRQSLDSLADSLRVPRQA